MIKAAPEGVAFGGRAGVGDGGGDWEMDWEGFACLLVPPIRCANSAA